MTDLVEFGLQAALVALVLLLLPVSYRIVNGPTQTARLQAVDALTTLLVGLVVIVAVVQEATMFVDVGLALIAFSFIATLGIARYVAQGRVF